MDMDMANTGVVLQRKMLSEKQKIARNPQNFAELREILFFLILNNSAETKVRKYEGKYSCGIT